MLQNHQAIFYLDILLIDKKQQGAQVRLSRGVVPGAVHSGYGHTHFVPMPGSVLGKEGGSHQVGAGPLNLEAHPQESRLL